MNYFRYSKLVFFERDTTGQQVFISDKQPEFDFLSLNDFKASPFFKEKFATDYENRFLKGDLCVSLCIDKQIVNVSWLAKEFLFINELEREHTVFENEIIIYDVITKKSERGKGYYPLMLEVIIGWAQQNGYQKVCIFSEAKNDSSIAGIIKAGFHKKQTISLFKFAGFKLYFQSNTDITR
jgi:hypothetical protein